MNAIVTGVGRPSGIGAAIAFELAQKGCNMFLTSCLEYDIENGICKKDFWDIPSEYIEIKERCQKNDVKVLFKSFDLTSRDACSELFDDASRELGNIHLLVTSHCVHTCDKLGEINDSFLNRNLRVNSGSVLLLIQEFYRRFSDNEGSIVAISSTQELEPLVNEISYAISKASVPIIVSTLAPILAQKGIRINAVNPGATEIGAHSDDIEEYKRSNLFGRVGRPTDAAHLVSFLCSNEGRWITGQTINSEGCFFRKLTALPLYDSPG